MKKLLILLPVVSILAACDSYKDKLYKKEYQYCMEVQTRQDCPVCQTRGGYSDEKYCKERAFRAVYNITEEQAKFILTRR